MRCGSGMERGAWRYIDATRGRRSRRGSQPLADMEIGISKCGWRAYRTDELILLPSRRTRDPQSVDIGRQSDAYEFPLPLLGSAMDGVVSPTTTILLGRLGVLGVLNLEGLGTRYEDPEPLLAEIAELSPELATARMQEIYKEPMRE